MAQTTSYSRWQKIILPLVLSSGFFISNAFAVDPINTVRISGGIPVTRTDGSDLNISELDRYEISYHKVGEAEIIVPVTIAPTLDWLTPVLTPGTYVFKARVVEIRPEGVLMSAYTDEESADISVAAASIIIEFKITIGTGPTVTVGVSQ